MNASSALDAFHPIVARWFTERHGAPTDVQTRAWPHILAGEHVLATAPTGSGKTLCAFLTPLDHLLSGRWETGGVRVLYISPLKALNNDIQRNLLEPLAELEARWQASGATPPRIHVATRSGDTPPEERRRMQRQPPEILITTPESLNIMLTSAGGRSMLGGLEMLILDEIHAVAPNRRGLWLMSGVEALADLAGEFQRVALSATVRPLEDVARLVGGHRRDADGAPQAQPRPVTVLRSTAARHLDLRVSSLPPDTLPDDAGLDALSPIARSIRDATERNRSTLVFTNSRMLCEKLALRVNASAQEHDGPLAWAHHGALSREIRLEVEARLKAGRLRAIVATSSLEMGIDIGSLDEVVMVQSPPSVAAAIQRAGRAGHGVGETSRAVIQTTHPQDVLEAAVLAQCALASDIEATELPGPCLDVLAQVIVTRLAMAPACAEALFDAVRCATPYRQLTRTHFDLVLQMLLGRYADSRVRELKPRLLEDGSNGILRLQRGTLLALYSAGGMIPNRGYFQLRHAETGMRIGELDEEFVWENGPGSTFSLGSQQWRVQRVTHNDVHVTPAPEAIHAPPFWIAEDRDRDPHFSARLREFLETCDAALDQGPTALEERLTGLPLDDGARAVLTDYLSRQRKHTGAPLPHARHVLAETVRAGPGGQVRGANQLVLHNLAGGRINRPWALAIAARWRQLYGEDPELFASNDAVVIQMPDGMSTAEVLTLVHAEDVEALLRERLQGSGIFGARFRECAGRALLLSRSRLGERLPLWMSRVQSQRLLGRVRRYGDFPILLEAWRSCLVEAFDLPGLTDFLDGLHSGAIAVTEVTSQRPSPFAVQLGWEQINQYMYTRDTPRGVPDTGLAPTLLESVVGDARLRPAVNPAIAAAFMARRRRLLPGWGPRDRVELEDWLRERLVIEDSEWEQLLAGLDANADAPQLATTLELDGRRWWLHARDAARLTRLITPATSHPGSDIHTESAPAEDDARLELLRDWLAFQPPSTFAELARTWPGSAEHLATDLRALQSAGAAIHGVLLDDDPQDRWCDTENFEAMLRMQRAAARPTLTPLAAQQVAGFIASWQRVGTARDTLDALEALRLLPVPADLWEHAVLPARLGMAAPAELDTLLSGDGLLCTGAGRERRHIVMLAADELDAWPRTPGAAPDPAIELAFADPLARYSFEALRQACDDDPQRAAATLWEGVFAGHVALDDFAAVRHGLATGFALPGSAQDAPAMGRGSLRARVRARVKGIPGRFQLLPTPGPGGDAVDRIERARERARILIERWGVVCPTLLKREAKGLRWSDVFRALRLMELAGEVTTGLFLHGLDGPQFACPEAITRIRQHDDDTTPRWMDARDPASPCGLGLPLTGVPLPERRSGCELVLAGSEVALVVKRSGRALSIAAEPNDERLDSALACLAATFAWRRNAHMSVDTINDAPARTSPYAAALRRHFDVGSDHRRLLLAASSTAAAASGAERPA